MNRTLAFATMKTPVGRLHLAAQGDALCLLAFEDRFEQEKRRLGEVRFLEARDPAGAVAAMGAYLEGEVGAIDRLRVEAAGTDWQKKVWAALRRIPAGETCSYGALARTVGRPGAARAVGAANRTNPVAIVVPCHRVIAADDTLCGYGGGLSRKRWLLDHEARHSGLFAASPRSPGGQSASGRPPRSAASSARG